MRTLIKDVVNKEGQEVELAGYVAVRRDHGKIIFVDLRDRSGILQLVFTPKDKAVYETAIKLRSEWVIKVKGIANKRPANMVN